MRFLRFLPLLLALTPLFPAPIARAAPHAAVRRPLEAALAQRN
jgi:hypothetical protein